MLGRPVEVEFLNDLHDADVQLASPSLEQARIGDLVRQRVLEGVFDVREETGLVEELRGLEILEPSPDGVLGQRDDGLEENEGQVLADHRGRLKQALLLRW